MRIQLAILSALALCGCKSIEGRYVPGCAAFAGDTVELHAGRFTWDRFTDAVRVDAEGNEIDPFPEFPKTGHYAMNGEQLELRMDGNDTPKIYSLQDHAGEIYLLTSAQAQRYADDGAIERCALVRDDARSN